jgi:hypothetical protein
MAENERAREAFQQRYIRDCMDTRGRIAENGFHWCLGHVDSFAAMLISGAED